ncbi:MAG: hypothetical protein RM049_20480 [Nostoc sp. DedQUE04]|nr:hypothetical protein [Nostoc sp. DedQUE04]MDZ8137648.1 hypothetical protein [Nostoc sp. DedQUE04]
MQISKFWLKALNSLALEFSDKSKDRLIIWAGSIAIAVQDRECAYD